MTVATKYYTYGEMRTQIEKDLDLEGEDFIASDELMGKANKGVEDAEKILLGLYADYFLTKAPLTLVSGTSTYDLPDKIYAHKIRGITYRNGSRAYQIHRVRDWRKFQEYELNIVGGPSIGAEYKWFLMNQSAGDPQIQFSPDVFEDGQFVTIWYQRRPNLFTSDDDILDIPEASNYIMQYMTVACYEKEGHPNLAKAIIDLARERADLEAVLAEMVPDMENEIEFDLSFYAEMN